MLFQKLSYTPRNNFKSKKISNKDEAKIDV